MRRLASAGLVWLLICPALLGQVITYRDTLVLPPAPSADTLSHFPVLQILSPRTDEGSWQVHLLTGAISRVSGDDSLSLVVIYTALAGPLKLSHGPAWRHLPSLAEIRLREGSAPGPSTPSPVQPRDPSRGSLVTAGTLFRGLSVTAGQGTVLSGGLDLRLQGDLGDGIFIQATLTDRNLPVQPEGNTRALEELDQVRLAIIAPWGTATAGDFVLHSRGGPLQAFQRKLEGLQLQLGGGEARWQLTGVLAGTKGRYRSQILSGEDGRQGPYYLSTENGSRALVILSGTETVWLNGQRLERGERYDYTIDYQTGDLFFTPRHTIRNDSRIVIDFEYSDLVYKRTTAFLSADFTGDRSSLTLTAFSEGDDPASSLTFSLSAADRQQLQQAGDPDSLLTVTGALLAEGGGYDLVNGRYVWQGIGAGAYRIAFSQVGAGGSYRRLVEGNRLIYAWVPAELRQAQGAIYAPYRHLTAPQRQDMLAARWLLRGSGPNRLVQMEAALSRQDLNSLSSLDDGDNLNVGYSGKLAWQSSANRSWQAGLELQGQGRQAGFRPLGRWDAVELLREWDLENDPAAYRWITAKTTLEQAGIQAAFAEWGRLNLPGQGRDRIRWGVNRQAAQGLSGRFNQSWINRIEEERIWTITGGDIKYNFNHFAPFISYHAESRTGSPEANLTVQQQGAGIELNTGGTRWRLGREERREEAIAEGGLEYQTRQQFWRLGVASAGPGRPMINIDLAYNSAQTSGSGTDLNYLLGSLALHHRPPGGPGWIDLRHRIERTIAQTHAVLYDSVAAGLGQFRYDPVYDSFVPDPAGSYMRRVVPIGLAEPVVALQSRVGGQVNLNRLERMPAAVRKFAEMQLRGQGRVQSRSRREAALAFRLPAVLDTMALSFRGSWQIDASWQLGPAAPRYVISSSGQANMNRIQARTVGGDDLAGEQLSRSRRKLRRTSRGQLWRLPFTLDGRLFSGQRQFVSAINARRDYHIDETGLTGTASLELPSEWSGRQGITLSFTGSWRREINGALADLEAVLLSAGVGLERKLGRTGRLKMHWEQLAVRSSLPAVLPLTMMDGFPVGISSRLRASGLLKLGDNLNLTLTLFSRQEAGRPPLTTANLELRSQF